MKKKFISNSFFQDLLCCRKWWKHSWCYWYFPIVLNIFNLAKTRNIIGSSKHVILVLLRIRFNFFSFFKFFFINVHFYHFWILFFPFPSKLQIACFLLSSFQEWDQLNSPWKIKPHENKNFLTCPHRVTTPFLQIPTENENYLIPLPIFLQFYIFQVRRCMLL